MSNPFDPQSYAQKPLGEALYKAGPHLHAKITPAQYKAMMAELKRLLALLRTVPPGQAHGPGQPSAVDIQRMRDQFPDPAHYDMRSIAGQAKFNADMMKFQQALTGMQNYWKAISDMLKSQSDTQSKISGNLR